MEPNQVNPSPENAGIPQGIPTGVFVPNNQVPAQTPATADKPVQNTVSAEPTQAPVVVTPVVVVTSTVQAPAAPAKEGPLDKILKGLARFFAKVMGQPDPITGVANPASQALQKSQNIVGKMRGAANQAVAKATDVAGKAVNTATNVANQAAQQVQQAIPQPTTAPVATPSTEPIQAQPVIQPTPVVEQPVQVTPPTV